MDSHTRINNRAQKELRLKLKAIRRLPENSICAECKITSSEWASTNLGLFICMDCAGVHRGLGTHITKIKSCTMDTWTPKEVAFMESIGNAKANSYWEARLPYGGGISPTVNSRQRAEFIRSKYEQKKYYAAPMVQPSKTEEPKKSTMLHQWYNHPRLRNQRKELIVHKKPNYQNLLMTEIKARS